MRVGILTNLNSRKNRSQPQRGERLQRVLGADGLVRQTRHLDEIRPVLEEFIDRGVRYWVSDGGDGTLHWMLLFVAEPRECRGTNPPIVVRTTCGRRNPVGVIYVRRSFHGYEILLNEQMGGFLRGVSTHEIGHALIGWKHVTNRPSLMNPYLSDPRPTPLDVELLCSRHREVPGCRLSTAPDQPLTSTTEATLLRR